VKDWALRTVQGVPLLLERERGNSLEREMQWAMQSERVEYLPLGQRV
jgi:hypothetical protein